MSEIFSRNKDTVCKYACPNYGTIYSMRKGSVTYTITGTTYPPPILSIAYCREWSIEKVLDAY